MRLLYRTDFFTGICGVALIKNVHNRHHFHRIAISVFRINVVLYGDKSYSKCWKDIIDILPDLDIVSSKARQVFHDNCIDDADFRVV